MMNFKGLSLFANVGIAETYLKDCGIDMVLANELIENRANFYKEIHYSDVIIGDINKKEVFNEIIKKSKSLNINFILATPPCQGMSKAGKMSEQDPRNTLIIKAMNVFEELLPDAMLIENVPEMFKTFILIDGERINIKDYLENICEKLNYNVDFDIFDAADYGTPQFRKRSFTRIYKQKYVWNNPIKQKPITVHDAIGNLPSLESGEKSNIPYHEAKKHNENHILWMKNTPTGKSAFENIIHYPKKDGRKIKGFKTTYKRISWDKPAPTITMANGSVSSQSNVHPGKELKDGTYSDARVLTLLEIFKLTGLPDNWSPPKWASENMIRHVIGEAIPPKLIKAIVEQLKEK